MTCTHASPAAAVGRLPGLLRQRHLHTSKAPLCVAPGTWSFNWVPMADLRLPAPAGFGVRCEALAVLSRWWYGSRTRDSQIMGLVLYR